MPMIVVAMRDCCVLHRGAWDIINCVFPKASPHATQHAGTKLSVLVATISVPYVRANRARVATVLLSIALGVAAIVASGNLIESAIAGLTSSWTPPNQRAQLRVANGFAGVPDRFREPIENLERVKHANAIVVAEIDLLQPSASDPARLIGIDLMARSKDDLESSGGLRIEVPDETVFLSRLDAVILDQRLIEQAGLSLGDRFDAKLGAQTVPLIVAGRAHVAHAETQTHPVVWMDLPAAQLLLHKGELVDAIDVTLIDAADAPHVRKQIQALIDGYGVVTGTADRVHALESLIANIRLILAVPGIIAIVVGTLVIRHAVTTALSARKPQLDVVRAIGVSRASLLALFAAEGLMIGGAGSAAGVVLGRVASPFALTIVHAMISSLYQQVPEIELRTSGVYLLCAIALGVGMTLILFLTSVRGEIGSLSGLFVTGHAHERNRQAFSQARWGLGLVGCGAALGQTQKFGLAGERLAIIATAGDALMLFGVGLLIPMMLVLVGKWTKRQRTRFDLGLVRLAIQGLVSDAGRTGAVATAIVVGCAYVIITVGSITSIRQNVVRWLEGSQRADLIVSEKSSIGILPSARKQPTALEARVRAVPGVGHVEATSSITQPHASRWSVVVSRNPDSLASRYPLEVLEGSNASAIAAMKAGTGGPVSRHFVVQHDYRLGDTVRLNSPTGSLFYRIEAIVDDLSSADLGTIFVSNALMRSRWLTSRSNALHVWVQKQADSARVQAAIAEAIAGVADCVVLTKKQLIRDVERVVDGMFYVSYAIVMVACAVVIVAILNFFATTLSERAHEFSILRDIGATRRQLLAALLMEAAAIGLIGSAVGCAIGIPLARRMTEVTMRAGGGLEFDFILPLEVIPLTVATASIVCGVSVLLQLRFSSRLRPLLA